MQDLALNGTSWCYRAVGQKPCPECKRVSGSPLGLYGDMEKKMETTGIIGVRGCMGIVGYTLPLCQRGHYCPDTSLAFDRQEP